MCMIFEDKKMHAGGPVHKPTSTPSLTPNPWAATKHVTFDATTKSYTDFPPGLLHGTGPAMVCSALVLLCAQA